VKAFIEEELSKYDGSNGIAYVACYGKVYDLSASCQWGKGVHQVTHRAGCDLSDALEWAPQCFSLLDKFSIVGEMVG
jgi:predicted heme/steroid binding protein